MDLQRFSKKLHDQRRYAEDTGLINKLSTSYRETGSPAGLAALAVAKRQRGLNMLEAAGPDEVAHLWEVGFKQHWGQHLVDAERHLYALKINNRLC